MAIRTAGIISKPRKAELQEIIPSLLKWLEEKGIRAYLDRETAASLDSPNRASLPAEVIARNELSGKCDLVIVLGGDGTLLAAARNVHSSNIPILAVNLGTLGFLTAITTRELYSSLELILNEKHQIDRRKLLRVQMIRSGVVGNTHHALNDVVLNKAAISRISDFEAYVDGVLVSVFKADGLIVSTPTGSTAYSMAAGGPIVYPTVEAFIVTPICPHTLTNRPLVVPDSAKIEIIVKTESESVFLTVDGQVGLALHNEDRIVCDLSTSWVSLVRPPQKEFFEVLRNKLKWGER